MANSDKNIVITPNRGLSGQPEISFTGVGNSTTTLKVADGVYSNIKFESYGTPILNVTSNPDESFKVSTSQNISVIDLKKNGEVDLTVDDYVEVGGNGLVLPSTEYSATPENEEGLIVYDKDLKVPKYNDGTRWINLSRPERPTKGLVLLLDAANILSSNAGITTNWSDISGNRNDGIIVNGPRYTTEDGGAFIFDGIDDYIQLSSFFNYNQFTISLWVKPAGSQVQYADIFDNNHTGARNFVLQQNSTTLNQYGFGGAGAFSYTFDLNSNEWVNLTFTWNNSTMRFYRNGIFVASSSGSAVTYDSQTLRIGGWQAGGRHWHGRMGNFIVYDRELPPEEVTQIFNVDRGRFGI